MRKFLGLLLLLCGPVAYAQTTTVTGTIVDPNSNPYANGTVSAQTIVPTGQASFSTTPSALSAAGFFSIVLPSPKTYVFTLCAAPVNLGPRANPTPPQVCFTSPPIAVSGASQDVTSAVGVAALLGPNVSSIAGNAATATQLLNTPVQCGVGNLSTGIAANGNANCVPPPVFGSPGAAQCNVGGALAACPDIVDLSNVVTTKVDALFCGPSPYVDIRCKGGYASNTPPSTTGTITSGTATLTLGAAIDFANGHGIMVPKAGPVTALTTPAAVAVAQFGGFNNGATTYSYQVVMEDSQMALTAPSVAATTLTGPATLGRSTITLTQVVRSGGTTTYTASATHNLVAGQQVVISNFVNFQALINGIKWIATVPTATTFTVAEFGLTDVLDTSGGTAVVNACNRLSWAAQVNAYRGWIYKSGTLIGVAPGADPVYVDCGDNINTGQLPAEIPVSVPGAAQNAPLVTTVASGGGTTTLTLADSASASVAGVTVLHDNFKPLVNAILSFPSGAPIGTVRLPRVGASWVFNAMTVLPASGAGNTAQINLELGDTVKMNNPMIVPSHYHIIGLPGGTSNAAFQNDYAQSVSGTAYPLFLSPQSVTANSVTFDHINFLVNLAQQGGYVSEPGPVQLGFVDDYCVSAAAIGARVDSCMMFKGDAFQLRFLRGVYGNGGGGADAWTKPGIRFTGEHPNLCGGGGCEVAGYAIIDGITCLSTCIQQDGFNTPVIAGSTGNITIKDVLTESLNTWFFRGFYSSGTSVGLFDFQRISIADNLVSQGTPAVEFSGSSSPIFGPTYINVSGMSLCVGGATDTMIVSGPCAVATAGATSNYTTYSGPSESRGNNEVNLSSYVTGHNLGIVPGPTSLMGIAIQTPFTAPGAFVSVGGAVPLGTYNYQCLAVGWDNGESAPGNASTPVTTTGGNQAVTITCPTLLPGMKGWNISRNGARIQGSNGCSFPTTTTTTTIDASNTICGQSGSGGPYAASSYLLAGEMGSIAHRFVNTPFSSLIGFGSGFALTTNRNIFIPDVDGVNVVSSYLNNGYDAFNRANGGLGSNWTAATSGCPAGCGTLRISSNQVIAPASSTALSIWNVSQFAPNQFAQDTFTSTQNADTNWALMVRASAPAYGGYGCKLIGTNSAQITKNNVSQASATFTAVTGDVMRCEIVTLGTSAVITMFDNGTLMVTFTDASNAIQSGQPGLFFSQDNSSTDSIDNFSAGNLHPISHLDVEQDWTQTQHLSSVTIGASTNTPINKVLFEDCGTTSTCAKTQQSAFITVKGGPIALAAGTLTVTSLPFTSSTSYVCSPDDSTSINGIDVIYNSGSSVTFNGTGTDSIRYVCTGN